MTYEEKLSVLEQLKAEVAGKPQVLGTWDAASSIFERADEEDFEPATTSSRVDAPAIDITDEEIRALFPNAGAHVAKGSAMGRKGLPAEFVERLYKSYLKGYSIARIARRIGRTRQSLFDTFQRRGFKLRPNSRARKCVAIVYQGVEYCPTKDGYLRATTGERPLLHWVVWQEFNGPIPAGHQIIFCDGNKRNFAIENLIMEKRADGLARVRTNENGVMKARRRALDRGDFVPAAPNGYDLAFLTWFRRHGWQVVQTIQSFEVWTNGDAVCKFRVTEMMIERLAHAGHFVAFHPPNDPFVTHWGLAENRSKQIAA